MPDALTSGPVPALRPRWRPVGPEELALIEASGWRRFPPRLPEQPIFYPVCREAYATQIARDWNVKASGAGFVMAFDIEEAWAARYPVRRVGGELHDELWVPAEELEAFNDRLVGPTRLVATFRLADPPSPAANA